MRLTWLTDIHLNFLDEEQRAAFYATVAADPAAAVLITGDIAVGPTVARLLEAMAARLARPIYFVLGNHDFWGSDTAAMEATMTALTARSEWLTWLGAARWVELAPGLGLLGHDGWYDGREGDYEGTAIGLNDFTRIADFAYQSKPQRLATMQRLAGRAADFLAERLPEALAACERVVVLTHVPPFREATWHEGRHSGDDWLPFMCSRVTGDVLRAAAAAHPSRRITVLCGHTHGAGEVELLPNLRVLTGAAVYGAPALQPPLELGASAG